MLPCVKKMEELHMKKKLMIAFMLSACLCLCIGCGKNEQSADEEEEQTVSVKKSKEMDIQKVKEGAIELKSGPKELIKETANVNYRIYDAQFFSNIDEAGIEYNEDDLSLEILEPKDSGFILMKMDVENIDYVGDDYGTLNISSIMLEPRDYDIDDEWSGGSPNYFTPHQEGQNYFGLSVEPGETKTCTIGFFVKDTDAAKKDNYIIDYCGTREDGYVFEIPWKE